MRLTAQSVGRSVGLAGRPAGRAVLHMALPLQLTHWGSVGTLDVEDKVLNEGDLIQRVDDLQT